MENTRQPKKGKWHVVTEANGDLTDVQSPLVGPGGAYYGNMAPSRTMQPLDGFRQTNIQFKPEPLQSVTNALMMG